MLKYKLEKGMFDQLGLSFHYTTIMAKQIHDISASIEI